MADEERKLWYTIKDINTIDSPALVIYKERVEENIRLLISMISDVQRLRPHVKTHKTKEASALLIRAGVNKFKCATIAEAEMLAMTGAADILLAYQPVGPKLLRFISLILRYSSTTFSCLIDNLASAKSIADASLAEHLTVPVFVDVNVGMNRTGISPSEAATFYETCTSLPGIKLQGLHFYDGQIRTKNFEQRTKECDETFIAIDDIIKNLAKKGFKEVIVIAGGSPTFPIHLKRKNVECSPGTFIFWDKSYEALCAEQPFITAALVITRVVSLPDATTLCLDLGHKSIASENELDKRVYFLNAPDLKVKGHSEEHMVVEAREGHPYKPGHVLYGLPFHICPTVALYERGLVIENKAVSTEWKIVARDRKLTV